MSRLRAVPELKFSRMPYGTHQIQHDLAHLLYRGAAGTHRRNVVQAIHAGKFGGPEFARLSFLTKLHSVLAAKLERGMEPSSFSVQIRAVYSFYSWVDATGAQVSERTIRGAFVTYTEFLRDRTPGILAKKPKKNAMYGGPLSAKAAFRLGKEIADLIARALDLPRRNGGASLLRTTRLKRPKDNQGTAYRKVDKQSLSETLTFGRFLADICDGLSAEAIRGQMPLTIAQFDGKDLVLTSGLRSVERRSSVGESPSASRRWEENRAPVTNERAMITRSSLINLRIEAELLIFVAQTGMNLSQAARLRRETFRWQTDGEDVDAFRVFKGRRSGLAIFRAFRVYRKHLERYLAWLDSMDIRDEDSRLFPFVYKGKIPPNYALPKFSSTREHCKQRGLAYVGPRSLRGMRVNWLLARTGDPSMTAEMSAHTEATLLRNYAKPNHHLAASEIARFHAATDPSSDAAGGGACLGTDSGPAQIEDAPESAPLPDCVSPEGCLFCQHHRDVESEDYCWRLASHAHIKTLEASRYRPPRGFRKTHPAHRVIERIQMKLEAIAQKGSKYANWVKRAREFIRAGRYHPVWKGHIQLLEIMS